MVPETSTEELEEKKVLVEKMINELLARILSLGEQGLIDESLKLVDERDRLQNELTLVIEKANDNGREKRMEACEVCSAYLVIVSLNYFYF